MSGSTTSATFLDRLRERDAAAWRVLVDAYGPRVYGWVRRFGLDEHDAADVLQEVFRSVVTGIARFRKEGPEDRFQDWLWTIARRRCIDVLRRRGGQPAARGGSAHLVDLAEVPEDRPPDFDGTLDPHDRLVRGALERVRGEFRDRTWQAFERTALHGEDAKDVAASLEMSLGALYVARSRVLKRIRDELDGFL